MPARYDTIIVVRKRNARGELIEYHTVGRKGPSIWRTGEPNPPGTPGYQAAYDAATGLQAVLEPPATGHGWHTVNDLLDAYERSREFCRLAPRTRTDYLKGLVDVRAKYGSAPLGVVNSVALKGNVLDWIEMRWAGKAADKRLDPFKFALSWATGRHPERVPVNYLHGIPRFYEGADRAEIICALIGRCAVPRHHGPERPGGNLTRVAGDRPSNHRPVGEAPGHGRLGSKSVAIDAPVASGPASPYA